MMGQEIDPADGAGLVDLSGLAGRSVLVTGARGFLGRHLAMRLRRIGATPVGTTRASGPTPGEHGITDWRVVDMADGPAVDRLVASLRPDAVLHMAGFASGANTPEAVTLAFEGNVLSTFWLLTAVQRHCPSTRVVLAGSLESSDPMRGPAAFWTPYGASKVLADIVVAMSRRFAGVPVVSARIGSTYGPDEPHLRRLVPYVVTSLLAGVSPRLSSGTRRLDLVHVEDVVTALLGLVACPTVPDSGVDVGTGRLHSIRELVELIRVAVGTETRAEFNQVAERQGDQVQADLGPLRACLGWTPAIRLEDGIVGTVDAYRAVARSTAQT